MFIQLLNLIVSHESSTATGNQSTELAAKQSEMSELELEFQCCCCGQVCKPPKQIFQVSLRRLWKFLKLLIFVRIWFQFSVRMVIWSVPTAAPVTGWSTALTVTSGKNGKWRRENYYRHFPHFFSFAKRIIGNNWNEKPGTLTVCFSILQIKDVDENSVKKYLFSIESMKYQCWFFSC
jgi:hypothetical protein